MVVVVVNRRNEVVLFSLISTRDTGEYDYRGQDTQASHVRPPPTPTYRHTFIVLVYNGVSTNTWNHYGQRRLAIHLGGAGVDVRKVGGAGVQVVEMPCPSRAGRLLRLTAELEAVDQG